MVSVGLCEDDPQVRRVVEEALAAVDLDVVVAHRAAEAIRAFTPDSGLRALVLDIGLPDGDGRDLCQALRAAGVTAPVLFLTARGGVHEVVAGFGAGGDDYLVKPFAVAELQARVTALVRRAPTVPPREPRSLHLDPGAVLRPARRRGGAADARPSSGCSPRLLARPGEVVRRRELIAAAWPVGAVVQANTLDSYMRRLRRLLEQVRRGGAAHHRARRRVPAGMTDGSLRSSASVRRSLTAATAVISTVGMLTLVVVVLLVAWRTTDHEMDQVLDTRLRPCRRGRGRRRPPDRSDPDDATFDDSELGRGPRRRASSPGRPCPRASPGPWRASPRGGHGVGAGRGTGASGRRRCGRARTSAPRVVAIDTGPYRSGLGRLIAASVITGVIVVAGMTLLAGLIVRRALAPVADDDGDRGRVVPRAARPALRASGRRGTRSPGSPRCSTACWTGSTARSARSSG